MSEPINLMFDTETLGTRERAVVTTIACVPFSFDVPATFDQLVKAGFYLKLDGRQQIRDHKRETDQGTIDWWKKQPQEAREASILPRADDVSQEEACERLRAFIKRTGYDFKTGWAWSRGAAFDFPKIESLYHDLGQLQPINGFMIRDTRTAIDVLTGSLKGDYELRDGIPKTFMKHHALHDAALEVLKLKEIHDLLASE